MHDPSSVAFEIRYPWLSYPKNRRTTEWSKTYRDSFITIWHEDPETDGTDDSCGWFIRGRHLGAKDKALAERLIKSEHDNIKFWMQGRDDQEMISNVMGIFAALRRQDRPWYKHPKWHIWHWRIQIHPWQKLRRHLLSRCNVCGGKFAYGEAPVSNSWDSPPKKFLRGETHLHHQACGQSCAQPKQEAA